MAASAAARAAAAMPGASPAEVAESVYDIAVTPFLTGEIINLNGGAFMRP